LFQLLCSCLSFFFLFLFVSSSTASPKTANINPGGERRFSVNPFGPSVFKVPSRSLLFPNPLAIVKHQSSFTSLASPFLSLSFLLPPFNLHTPTSHIASSSRSAVLMASVSLPKLRKPPLASAAHCLGFFYGRLAQKFLPLFPAKQNANHVISSSVSPALTTLESRIRCQTVLQSVALFLAQLLYCPTTDGSFKMALSGCCAWPM
jgi:hypothetical protein